MSGAPRVVVVGGGPAGLSAAAEAARHGGAVTLVDEGARLGGQYFHGRQGSADLGSPEWFRNGRGANSSVDVRAETTVVDARDSSITTWHPERRLETLPYDWLVLATGGYDRPVALPGWTLPGVMTAGGMHTLAKLNHTAPGSRIVVSGAGPFILSVADVLVRLGCRVTTLEATQFGAQVRGVPALFRDPELLGQAAGYMARLTLRRARPRYGWAVVEVLGQDRVEGARIQRLDRDWRPIPATDRTVEADAVCLGFGFVPRLDVAQLLDLQIGYQVDSSDYRVVVDETMVSSSPRVFAAGEVTGIGGVRVAHVEGRIAGLTVARAAGLIDEATDTRVRTPLLRRARTLWRTAEWLRTTYAPRPGLWELASNATTLCRCEDVSFGSAETAAALSGADPAAVKAATRIGMGLCQGRTCSPLLIEWLRATHGYAPAGIGRPWRVRPPISPVPISDLAGP